MKRLYFLLVPVLFCFTIQAQNYSCFPTKTSESYYVTNKGYVVARAFDSVKVEGADTVLYNFKSARELQDGKWKIFEPSWLGNKIIIKSSGKTFLYNSKNEQIVINTLAKTGDSWTLFSSGSIYYSASVESVQPETFLGITDSVKTISLASSNGVYKGKQIKISKNHGLLSFPQIYNFPDSTLTFNSLFGNDGAWINMIGSTSIVGSQLNLTSKDIFNFQIGDEFRTLDEYSSGSGSFGNLHPLTIINTVSRTKIISREDSINQIKYSVEKCGSTTLYDMNHQSGHKTYGKGNFSITYKLNGLNYHGGPSENLGILNQIPEKTIISNNHVTLVSMFYKESLLNKNVSLNFYLNPDSTLLIGFGPISGTNYIEGLGGGYYSSSSGGSFGDGYSNYSLQYYKKGDKEFGQPLSCPELLSVDDVSSETKFNLYPSPAEDVINIESSHSLEGIEIINHLGQIVLATQNSGSDQKVDISKLSSGIYTLSARLSNGQVKRQKISVK